MTITASQLPTPDHAEHNAFFPSPYALEQFTRRQSDLSGAEYTRPYRGRQKILVIAADERYLPTASGALFSTGNHPLETLVPMYHLHQAGFSCEVATLSGLMVKFEHWAMPDQDQAITRLYYHYLPQFLRPRKLHDIVRQLSVHSEYAGIFIPGGHGALIGLPSSDDVAAVLRWALAYERYLIAICHGPAAFLALAAGDNPLQGYTICAFPDALDRQTPAIGYMPGQLTWFFGEKLQQMGLTLVNQSISGQVHQDRKVLTGDSPLAANTLGKLAAETLLSEFVS
ncbi:glyoxalase III HchA [Edwardsiella tarda]|uniref:glyoxalase III HchA n=1 Tax=Edwardsiella tarda TaxID=636 RepID=UPI000839FA76|nr:glyoxalase III HchA [Edwardsiella tarda]